jgi:hypothetical protein
MNAIVRQAVSVTYRLYDLYILNCSGYNLWVHYLLLVLLTGYPTQYSSLSSSTKLKLNSMV